MQYAASTIILCLILNGERTDPLGKRFSGRLFNKKKKIFCRILISKLFTKQ